MEDLQHCDFVVLRNPTLPMIGELRRRRKVDTLGMKELKELRGREIPAYEPTAVQLLWCRAQLGKREVVDRLESLVDSALIP
jgi:hypothetical protein